MWWKVAEHSQKREGQKNKNRSFSKDETPLSVERAAARCRGSWWAVLVSLCFFRDSVSDGSVCLATNPNIDSLSPESMTIPLTSNESKNITSSCNIYTFYVLSALFATSLLFLSSESWMSVTLKTFIYFIIHPWSLTRETGLQTAPPRWACWPGPRPRPSGAWWPDGVSSPAGTSPVWARCTSWVGWWCAGRCAGNHAWLRPWHPPWSWPESWCQRGDVSTN